MIEEKEGNRRCPVCCRRTIARWHKSAEECDDCFGPYFHSINRNGHGNHRVDQWIADNWKDDNEKALEDSRC